MMRLDDKIGDFVFNSNINFDDMAILELFSEEEEEGGGDWGVSTDL